MAERECECERKCECERERDLNAARCLLEKGFSAVLVKDGRILASEKGEGVKPLLMACQAAGADAQGSSTSVRASHERRRCARTARCGNRRPVGQAGPVHTKSRRRRPVPHGAPCPERRLSPGRASAPARVPQYVSCLAVPDRAQRETNHSPWIRAASLGNEAGRRGTAGLLVKPRCRFYERIFGDVSTK